MSEGESTSGNTPEIESELYFLVAKFLGSGPCKKAAEALKNEIEEHGLLSKRLDWLGQKHDSSFANLERVNSHITGDYLRKVCERLNPLLDKDVKLRVPGVKSILCTGKQSLLRSHKDVKGVELSPSVHAALIHRYPIAPPCKLANVPNVCNVVRGRILSGRALPSLLVPIERYSSQTCMFLRTLGHLSSVYCVAFDRTGTRIFTGADDHLVKVWCVHDGRLLATMRGHSSEIVDMNVNYENTLLAAGSIDKVIRVWNLQTLAPVAVLSGHTAMITSLEFSPYNRGTNRYMATTSSDGNVCLWQWNLNTNIFNPRPIKFQERSRAGAQMLCLSFSPGGTFLATGSSDPLIRVYMFSISGPEKLCELEAHSDRVDSIDFCHSGEMFVSGSKDGTARVWRYESHEWKSLLLNMSVRAAGAKTEGIFDANKIMKHRVTMVGWDLNDEHVITAVNDHSLRVWHSRTGRPVWELCGHTDEVYVLECHPKDPRIFMSAGHDGLIILWNLQTGQEIYRYHNMIDGQGHGAVYDCKFSPEGHYFAATDSHGHLGLFGWGPKTEKGKENLVYRSVPYEQFFHTDYRPLMRDANNFVLDEQTQQAPHLMPPPFLVDMDGNPHPPLFQRLVPGRENMQTSSLIPEMGVAPNGVNEVLSDPIENNDQPQQDQQQQQQQQQEELDAEQQQRQERIEEDNQAASILDEMIARMQEEQDAQMEVEAGAGGDAVVDADSVLMPPPNNLPSLRPSTPSRDRAGGPLSPSASPRGLRRSGQIEGVRQSVGNVPVSQPASQDDLLAWSRRVVTPMLHPAIARNMEEIRHRHGEVELAHFKFEKKKKRPPSPLFTAYGDEEPRPRKPKKKDKSHKYGTRGNENVEEEEDEEEAEEENDSGAETEIDEEEMIAWHSSSDSGSESSQYSDWTQDAGINLEPPKRKSTRRKMRRYDSGSDDEPSPKAKKKKGSPRKRKVKPPTPVEEEPAQAGECPDDMKPPPWITDVIPHKNPYVPQMGDELVYLRQGHEQYVKFVKMKKAYPIDAKKQPYQNAKLKIKEKELVKVVGIKYIVGPPTLCGLKLANIDPVTRKRTGRHFTIKYHDMADVIDFLVLRQHYDGSMQRDWKVGDRFRADIDDAWWIGTIADHKPFQPEYPDSHFQCFSVAWDNGEAELMSPWDLELIDDNELPEQVGGSLRINHDTEAYRGMMYNPMEDEWGENSDMETECQRIIQCVAQVMSLRIAEMFTSPVDLEAYPSYPLYVPYPTDLNTIKSRLEKRFYRRISALQWEVRLIEQNAAAFNYPGSAIVRYSEIVTRLMLAVIKDKDCTDVIASYNKMTEEEEGLPVNVVDHESSGGEGEEDEDKAGGSKTGKKRKAAESTPRGAKRKRTEACYNPKAWIGQCRELLQMMWECQDSEPFRYPVDETVYVDYCNIISTPMDLNTVREQLSSGMYPNPMDIGKDVRLIFSNAKNYNTNKKSKIYGMMLRLSALFEDQYRSVCSDYKSAMKYDKQIKTGLKRKRRRSMANSRTSNKSKNKASTSKQDSSDDEDDDDETEEEEEEPGPSTTQETSPASREASSSTTNSKQSLKTPTASSRSTRNVPTRASARKVKEEDSSDEATDASEEETKTTKTTTRGKTRRRVKQESEEEKEDDSSDDDDNDSSEEEDSDATEDEEEKKKPVRRRGGKKAVNGKAKKGKGKLTNGFSKPRSSPRKRTTVSYNEYEDDDECITEIRGQSSKRNKDSSSEAEEADEAHDDDNESESSSSSSDSDSDDESEASDSDSSAVESRTRRTRSNKKVKHSKSTKKRRTKEKKPARRRSRYEDDSDYGDSPSKRRTRNSGKRTVSYDNEDSEESHAADSGGSEDSDDDMSTTVSSRGRVRRLTQRARASLLGE